MIRRISYRMLTIGIILFGMVSVVSLAVSIVAFSRQASIAEDKATQAIRAAETASTDTANSVCTFVLTFVARPGEPGPSTPRGVLNERAARRAYVALGCARYAGPLPPPTKGP